jgi:hypothetical protein
MMAAWKRKKSVDFLAAGLCARFGATTGSAEHVSGRSLSAQSSGGYRHGA